MDKIELCFYKPMKKSWSSTYITSIISIIPGEVLTIDLIVGDSGGILARRSPKSPPNAETITNMARNHYTKRKQTNLTRFSNLPTSTGHKGRSYSNN